MATPYVSRNEFNDEQNAFYARITRYSDVRFDTLSTQIQADKTELSKQIGQLQRDTTNILAFQQTLMNAFNGFAQDIAKQVAEINGQIATMQQKMTSEFATQAERHNELMARVGKLERNEQS